MGVTINVNGLSLCHKASGGVVTATVPDVCKTPSPGGPVPIPYPNIAKSSDLAKGTKTVKADGGNMCAHKDSEFAVSTGDEPGSVGGVKSGVTKGKATWLSWSPNVKLEGKAAARLSDKMLLNKGNTVSMGGCIQPPISPSELEEELCEMACECRNAAAFQRCVAEKITEKYYENGYPKPDAPVWREVSMSQQGGTWQVIQNTAGTGPTSNPITPGGGIRPDCIGTDGAGGANRIIEMKFPGDTYNANQNPDDPFSKYNQAAEDLDADYDQIDVEEDCECWNGGGGGSPVPVVVPGAAPEEEGLSTGEKVLYGVGAVAVVAVGVLAYATGVGEIATLGALLFGGVAAAT